MKKSTSLQLPQLPRLAQAPPGSEPGLARASAGGSGILSEATEDLAAWKPCSVGPRPCHRSRFLEDTNAFLVEDALTKFCVRILYGALLLSHTLHQMPAAWPVAEGGSSSSSSRMPKETMRKEPGPKPGRQKEAGTRDIMALEQPKL